MFYDLETFWFTLEGEMRTLEPTKLFHICQVIIVKKIKKFITAQIYDAEI